MTKGNFNWKNTLRITLVFLVVLIFIFSAFIWHLGLNTNTETVESTINVTQDQLFKDDKPYFVMFSSQWCGYCQRFMPTFEKLKKTYKNDYNFVVFEAEDYSKEDYFRDFLIGGYPTIYILDPKIDNRVMLSQTIYDDFDLLKKELDRYLRIRKMIKK